MDNTLGYQSRGFNFNDIAWLDRLNKSGSLLIQSQGQMLIDSINDHGYEQLVHFPTRKKYILDLILASLPGQFKQKNPQTNLVIIMEH